MRFLDILMRNLILTTFAMAVVVPVSSPAAEPARSPKEVLQIMEKVADWQLDQRPFKYGNRGADDWVYGALYTGMMALDQVADSRKYHDAMVETGKQLNWKPGKRMYHADDHVVTQMYIELFFEDRDPEKIASTIERFNYILENQKTNDLGFKQPGATDRWSWCDALFMGPPAWLRLNLATGDKRYIDFMDREWKATSDFLYDKEEHLYFRDSTYFDKREANGKKVFWSRGNGWVLAGLARVLQVMPPEHPTRAFYLQQYKEMASKILTLQQPDGLWRSSLLDPESYPLKETSGSGFYAFALAWGINRGVLDRSTYEPAVIKAWDALVACVADNGKLQNVQPIGADPKRFDPTHSDAFGVGAFLLAGSEVYRLRIAEASQYAYGAFMPQRKDDFAWENERIAFRAYGPALQRGGEVSSGLDVWAKRTRKPVVERWYFQADYHEDHGEGLDFYKVGPSRGCGATGILQDGKLAVASNFVTYAILENGPEKLVFQLGYAPYEASGIKVTETRKITLQAGSNLNKIEVRFQWEGGPSTVPVAAGIVKREGSGKMDKSNEGAWVTYWEPEQAGNGSIAGGIVMSAKSRFVEDAQHVMLVSDVPRGGTLTYYAGAAWSKGADFPDATAWTKYVSAFKP